MNIVRDKRIPMNKNKPKTFLGRIVVFLLLMEDGILIGLFLIMLGMATVQILLRNFFSTGIVWGDVMLRIIILWIGLVGAMVASRKGDHISVDLIARYLPQQLKGLVKGICALVTALVCTVVAYYSLQFVFREFEEGGIAFAKMPVWVCEAIIPLAFTAIALRYFITSFNNLTAFLKSPD